MITMAAAVLAQNMTIDPEASATFMMSEYNGKPIPA